MLVVGLFLYTSSALAEEPSVELGKQLFNDSALGASTNVTSCGSCHPNGKGLEEAGYNPELAKMINRCIEAPLKGEPLDEDSEAMKSLMAYIKTLDK
ncbi:MAG: hypothetical protein KKD01_07785 [Proteobacteria bacterium]|nr:hypothetical protein [Pseudomonadota bacterium]MBU1140673.1 hypothetical protein [Pseudomonadota bacterium]MBU1234337.1 hypothetical protein [Pseudomonadota bacterium]MBU1420701.1 hypothetical protein [Pseudomonadota bacterium]MBU1454618.1 hypothetical protein [Pseudomonadota bacterium]